MRFEKLYLIINFLINKVIDPHNRPCNAVLSGKFILFILLLIKLSVLRWAVTFLLLPFQLQILEWRKGKQNDASSGILNQAGATALVPLWWGGHQVAASRGSRRGRRHCFHCSCHTCDAEYQVCGGG